MGRPWEIAVAAKLLQSCLTLCDPINGSPPGSSVPGILQARIVEWVAISFSRGSSQPRDRTRVSRIVGRHFTHWATREMMSTSIISFLFVFWWRMWVMIQHYFNEAWSPRFEKTVHWIMDMQIMILEKAMAPHSSTLAWRIPGMGEPGGLPFMGSHRVRHNWSNLAAAAADYDLLP